MKNYKELLFDFNSVDANEIKAVPNRDRTTATATAELIFSGDNVRGVQLEILERIVNGKLDMSEQYVNKAIAEIKRRKGLAMKINYATPVGLVYDSKNLLYTEMSDGEEIVLRSGGLDMSDRYNDLLFSAIKGQKEERAIYMPILKSKMEALKQST